MTRPSPKGRTRHGETTRWSLTVSLFFLVALLAVAGARAQEAPPDPLPYGRLSVEGVATRNVVPDQATIDFGVRQEASSAQAAFDSAQFVLTNIVVALRANEVPEEAMRTTGLTLRPVYRYDQGEPERVGYAAEGSVRVETTDLRRLANLIDAAVAAGANRIENLQYTFSGTPAVREELLDEAARQALQKADRIASALGQQVKSVAQVHEIAGGPVPLGRGVAFEAMAAQDAVVLPGTLAVEVRLQVEFVLAPAKKAPPAPALPEAEPAPVPPPPAPSSEPAGGTDD